MNFMVQVYHSGHWGEAGRYAEIEEALQHIARLGRNWEDRSRIIDITNQTYPLGWDWS